MAWFFNYSYISRIMTVIMENSKSRNSATVTVDKNIRLLSNNKNIRLLSNNSNIFT